jgi:hypothetical protein
MGRRDFNPALESGVGRGPVPRRLGFQRVNKEYAGLTSPALEAPSSSAAIISLVMGAGFPSVSVFNAVMPPLITVPYLAVFIIWMWAWARYSVVNILMTRKRLAIRWINKPSPTPNYTIRLRRFKQGITNLKRYNSFRFRYLLLSLVVLSHGIMVILLLLIYATKSLDELPYYSLPYLAGVAPFKSAILLSWVAGVSVYRLYIKNEDARAQVYWALVCVFVAAAECAGAMLIYSSTISMSFAISVLVTCVCIFLLGVADQVIAFKFYSPADSIVEFRKLIPPDDDAVAVG